MAITVHQNVKTVFLDIDDTLWENNLFFLQTHKLLCRMGRQCGHVDNATLGILERMEDTNIYTKGFGYNSFEASLMATIRCLVARSGRSDLHGGFNSQMLAWTNYLRKHPIIWMPGVEKTLPKLTKKFQTIVVTKGHHGDQMAKVIRSGMMHMLDAAEVVPHKNPSCFTKLLDKHQLDPATTVMVGNSPKSDINNAKRAGLRTVYIPHPLTWYREMGRIDKDGPETIEIHRFDDVMNVLEH